MAEGGEDQPLVAIYGSSPRPGRAFFQCGLLGEKTHTQGVFSGLSYPDFRRVHQGLCSGGVPKLYGSGSVQESRLLSTIADLRQLGIHAVTEVTELLLELRRNGYSDALFAGIVDLPERIAQETGTYFVAIVDGFQELKDLNHFKAIKEHLVS